MGSQVAAVAIPPRGQPSSTFLQQDPWFPPSLASEQVPASKVTLGGQLVLSGAPFTRCTHILGVWPGRGGLQMFFLDLTDLPSESYNSSSKLYCLNRETHVYVFFFKLTLQLHEHTTGWCVVQFGVNVLPLIPRMKPRQAMGSAGGQRKPFALQHLGTASARLDVSFQKALPRGSCEGSPRSLSLKGWWHPLIPAWPPVCEDKVAPWP